AFAIQSIQKRLPKIIGPALAGFVLDAVAARYTEPEAGRMEAMHWLVIGALALGLGSLLVQMRWMPKRKAAPPGPPAWGIVRSFDRVLKGLLLAEVFTRWCVWLVREFVVL